MELKEEKTKHTSKQRGHQIWYQGRKKLVDIFPTKDGSQ